jgi:dimeric dUTPase (all-alpha-NTP-PPase superfamily)
MDPACDRGRLYAFVVVKANVKANKQNAFASAAKQQPSAAASRLRLYHMYLHFVLSVAFPRVEFFKFQQRRRRHHSTAVRPLNALFYCLALDVKNQDN